ncbi:hypothetical protein QQZ08_006319 [Neonectria magnoliae]|uniref:Arylsulfotransferase n=1 Tax=Neonectria magnoliae TaxID=2732573 RepID=A0ABR1I1J7_9HYPO
MASSWRRMASAVLALAGSSLADITLYNDLDAFTALSNASSGFPSQTFRSSDIVAPVLHVNSFNHSAADDAGYIFIGSVYGAMRAGPMILDARDLSLVYADQRYDNTYTSHVQTINGSRHMVFWEGVHNRGHANGYGLVYNEHYDLLYNVTAQGIDDTLADMHEMQVTPGGTAIFTTYWSIPWDCTALGGPADGLLMENGFQEIDLVTKEVVFAWSATPHFDVADTYARYGSGFGVSDDSGFDFFHINSVEKTDAGDYLISSRHLSMLALISGKDGHPLWVLGGRRNQFLDLSAGQATNFGWQHDARFYKNQSHITMFDNHGEYTGPCKEGGCRTRGLHLAIDAEAMTARVVHEYYHPAHVDSGAMGGFRSLDSGNVLLGWGYNPGFVEYTPDGTVVMDVQRGPLGTGFQNDMFAYRVSKYDWTGRPRWLPSVAVDAPFRTTENATVWLSWNGATDIASWVVVGSPIPASPVSFVPANIAQLASEYANLLDGPENVVAVANRTGFETEVFLGNMTSHRYMAAAALTAEGTILGSTFVMDMASGQPCLMPAHVTSIWPAVDSPMTRFIVLGMIVGAVATLSTLGRWFWRRRYHLHTWDYGAAKYERIEPEERRID